MFDYFSDISAHRYPHGRVQLYENTGDRRVLILEFRKWYKEVYKSKKRFDELLAEGWREERHPRIRKAA